MIYISIALVLIACIFGYLANKIIDQRWHQLTKETQLNTIASEEALSAAVTQQLKLYDERINKTWETISTTKTELESLRLQVAIKRNS